MYGTYMVPDNRPKAFDSCLISNKSENVNNRVLYIKTEPKWLTSMFVSDLDLETGVDEPRVGYYRTNDLKSANNRKLKRINMFFDIYEPKFKSREVSLLMITLTRINYAKVDLATCIDAIKYRFSEILKRRIRGYFWTLEVSANSHLHYHLIVAVDRLEIKKIPDALKFEVLWGQRTQVEFVKKSPRGYLSKYLNKSGYRLLKFRAYGSSYSYL